MDYTDLAVQYALEYGLDPEIFVRQMMQESGMNPDAVSEKGAAGIAQIMPDSAVDPGFGIDPVSDRTDPEESLRFGAQYMRAMLDRYEGDYGKALAAYNAGPGRVDQYGGIPPIRETQNYVNAILGGRMQPQTPGGVSMGAPNGTFPGEDLLFGIQDDPERAAVMENLMARFRPVDPQQQASIMAELEQLSGVRPGTGTAPEGRGIFSLPAVRSVPTVMERMYGTR